MHAKRCFSAIAAAWACVAGAAVVPAAPFADNMVLQRGMRVPVWGTAKPGESVAVFFAGQTKRATAGADGSWRVDLDPMEASKEPRTLSIGERKIANVLVGEVWLASGQSNMEMPILSGHVRYRDGWGQMMTALARRSDIRFYTSPQRQAKTPSLDPQIVWRDFSAKTFNDPGARVPVCLRTKGLVSAVGFYYALAIRDALDVPVGLVDVSWGGSGIEPWYAPGGGMWNGMVAAFAPMACRGFIWYQGCTNAGDGAAYTAKMHKLYDSWAQAFCNPDLKMYFVQLAPFSKSWYGIQLAQARFAAEEKNAGMAVTCDLGNSWDVHANDKEPIARRLALHALKDVYGFDDVIADSPTLKSCRTDAKGRFVLEFNDATSWYCYTPDYSAPAGFEIAGEDGVFHPAHVANALAEKGRKGMIYAGRELIVASGKVKSPKRLRYLHGKPWKGSLYSGDSGLPLGPFEADAAAPSAAKPAVAGASAERDIPLSGEGWRYAKDPTCKLRAEAAGFDDSRWESVRVPHDWAISGPFNPKEDGGSGKLPWRGVGWYRRSFTLDAADAGKSVFLDFDGVMASPKVYVNGRFAGGWDYGYASFRVDATPFVKFGEKNVIAVRASTLDHRSRWYPGAGIYRKVVMKLRNSAHFAYNGIFATTPEVSKEAAEVCLEWQLEGAVPKGAQVEVAVVDPRREGSGPENGGAAPARKVGSAPAAQGRLSWREKAPMLWDVDAPNLYEAEVSLVDGGKTLSRERVRFGIRSIEFPVAAGGLANDWAANGFHLNGRRVQLQGVNLHSDLGLLGMAFDKSAMRRQLEIMKDMGANALRTSHNCPAPDVLDLCDEMGIVVWDECFDKWDGTAGRRKDQNLEEYVARNLQAFVKRDRNHPCVAIWSMGNEIGEGADGLTRERCRLFREKMREFDTTRPVGNGNIFSMSRQNVLDKEIYADLDITGWNYLACYRPAKAKYPAKPVVYSESASALSTYGFYLNPPPDGKRNYANGQFQVDSYDHNAGPDIADVEFDRMEQDRYVCGEFVWTGIDYLGEPYPFGKTARSSYFGAVDLTGVPKDRFYLYRSHWNKKDETVHILPHWNWKGREGRNVPVYVYTSGDSAELFLNGRSLGVRTKGEAPFAKQKNLLADAKASASSTETGRGNLEKHATDGDFTTRWCASGRHLPEWLQFDMGANRVFSAVTIDFEGDYGKYAYELQTSLDGKAWTTVFAKKKGGNEKPVFEKPVAARHLRVFVTAVDKGWASIREIRACEARIGVPQYSAYYDVCGKYRLRWFDVPYEPGELKAVAYRGGKRIGETVVKTAGEPAALALAVEPKPADDPGGLVWVQVDALDAKGARNPLAMNRVNFKLTGPGRIIGVGNGNPNAFESFAKTGSHPLFYGKAMAVVRRDGPGKLVLTASSDGLASATAQLP